MYTRNKLFANPSLANTGNWQQRHNDAVLAPRGPERPIVHLLEAWLSYADTHKKRYEDTIGHDYFLGQSWADIGLSIRTLLNGECGSLDCGTLYSVISDTLKENGFDAETGEQQ